MKLGLAIIVTIFMKSNLFGIEDPASSDSLPVIKIEESSFTPINGLKIDEVRLLAVGEQSTRKKLRRALEMCEVTEITVEEMWRSTRCQVFLVNFPSELIFVKDGEIIKRLPYWAIREKFLADLDNDSRYEFYFNESVGSGMVNDQVIGYNMFTDETYTLSERGQRDYRLFIEDGRLKVKVGTFMRQGDEVIGMLIIDNGYLPKFLIELEDD